MQDELHHKCLRQSATSAGVGGEHEKCPYTHLLSIQESLALETTKTAANFDGIANAKMTKPRREQHDDAKIQEATVFQGGGEDNGAGTGQVEGEDLRARQGLAKLGEHARLAHRFDPATLTKILAFDTAERPQAFVKELKRTPLTVAGSDSQFGVLMVSEQQSLFSGVW